MSRFSGEWGGVEEFVTVQVQNFCSLENLWQGEGGRKSSFFAWRNLQTTPIQNAFIFGLNYNLKVIFN